MRFFILIVFISSISINANAQRTLKVGFNFSPDYCYRTLKIDSIADYLEDLKKSRDNNEIPKLSFTTGIHLLYEINEKFGFESGIQYSNKGYALFLDGLVFGDQIDPMSQNSLSPSSILTKYNYKYLEIPFRFITKLGNNKLKFNASFGITPSIIINRTYTTTTEQMGKTIDNSKGEISLEFNKYYNFNLFPTISSGIDYTFNENFNLKVEPTFRYGILKIIDAPLTGYLWNVGLNMGIYYTLKNK